LATDRDIKFLVGRRSRTIFLEEENALIANEISYLRSRTVCEKLETLFFCFFQIHKVFLRRKIIKRVSQLTFRNSSHHALETAAAALVCR
jgi:hypothetical protein